jgi:hypothetical protein
MKDIKVRTSKQLSDMFPTENGLKQGDALLPLLLKFVLEHATRVIQDTGYITFWYMLMM